jgi:hypothetical protein
MDTPAACLVTAAPGRSRLNLGYQAYRAILALWKFFLGVIFTQALPGSVLIVGWTYRAAQRAVHRRWWKASELPKDDCFCDFIQSSSFHRGLGGWPNWIVEHNRAWMRAHRAVGMEKIRAVFKSLFHSLWLNFKIGVQGIFNTWVLTMPGCVLMLFSWYAGWHNSFNKGYEQAVVGPLTGVGGIILFIAAMYYVPMAQIRQASTGNWRAFYQFKTVWQIIRKSWLACFGLALLYSAFSVPVTLLKTVPGFFPQINPRLADLSATEALQLLKTFYFYAAFLVFPGYVLLRIVAARMYASSLLACIQSGAVPEDCLAENEWETLHRLDLLRVRSRPQRHVLVRTMAWLASRMGRITTGIGLFLVWFTFIGQVYLSEFLVRSTMNRGWLNQPLVQLPWFNYIPKRLATEAKVPANNAIATPRPEGP